MDLENNHRGRNLGEIYSVNSFNDNEIAKCILQSVYCKVRFRGNWKSSYSKN